MSRQPMTPPLTDSAMEAKMIALALQQAQTQLEKGTASSQIVTHFLRLGSVRAQVELEKLQLENNLIEEKILAAQAGQQMNEMFSEVMAALKSYSYAPPDIDDLDRY